MTKDTGNPKILKEKPDAEKKPTTILGGPKHVEKTEIVEQGQRGG